MDPQDSLLGYAVQFSGCPLKFSGILFTSIQGKNAAVLPVEVTTLLAKGEMEPVPPAKMNKGFYTPVGAELLDNAQIQNSGPSQILSEAPGAHGILSRA